MQRFEKKVAEAKALEERLTAEGRHLDAQVISRLRRAALSTHGTLKTAYRDNMDLRASLAVSKE